MDWIALRLGTSNKHDNFISPVQSPLSGVVSIRPIMADIFGNNFNKSKFYCGRN